MSSTFFGIETARRALSASQTVVDVTGHNIANVNTPGFSRQRADIAATDPYDTAGSAQTIEPLQIGTGVQITAVLRLHDDYLEQRIQRAGGDQQQLNTLRDTLSRVQSVYNEPSGGISSDLTAFYNAFQELSHNPENESLRIVVRDKGADLARHFQQVNTGLAQAQQDVLGSLTQTVDQANSIAKDVASLNKQIALATAIGEHPNDLQDRRDQLIQQLGTLVGANATVELDAQGKPTGALNVAVNGYTLVQGSAAIALPTATGTYNGQLGLSDGVNTIVLNRGAAAGLTHAYDLINSYKSDLNTAASTLISRVNSIHQTGYGLDGLTGRSFFGGTDAATIALDPTIATNTDAIAAATAPAAGQPVSPGNGDNARSIADLATTQVLGTQTIGDFYHASVSRIGSDTQSADRQSQSQAQVVNQLQNFRSSVSGVNMDEELTTMLQYQRSYQAAARLMTTMDDMIGRIVSGLGSAV